MPYVLSCYFNIVKHISVCSIMLYKLKYIYCSHRSPSHLVSFSVFSENDMLQNPYVTHIYVLL